MEGRTRPKTNPNSSSGNQLTDKKVKVTDKSDGCAHWRTEACKCSDPGMKYFAMHLFLIRQPINFLNFKAAHGRFSLLCKNTTDEIRLNCIQKYVLFSRFSQASFSTPNAW